MNTIPAMYYDQERDIWVIRAPDSHREEKFYPDIDAPELKRDVWEMEYRFPDNTPVGREKTWGELELNERLWELAAWAHDEWGEVEPQEDPDEGIKNTIHPPFFADSLPHVEIAASVCLHCGLPIIWLGGGERWGHFPAGPTVWYCPKCGAMWTSNTFYVVCPFCENTEIEVHHVAQPVDPEPYHLWVRAEQRKGKEEKREEQPTE